MPTKDRIIYRQIRCNEKTRYTKAEALALAEKQKMRAYECSNCGTWHLTSMRAHRFRARSSNAG